MKRNRIFRKTTTFLTATALLCACAMAAFAEESHLTAEEPETGIGVYVKYVDNTQSNAIPTDDPGNGTATLPDGTEIEISGADSSKGRLVIDLIEDREALEWLGGLVAGKAGDITAYHIYYLEADGSLSPADGVTVTVKPKMKLKNPVGYGVEPDGEPEELSVKSSKGSLRFAVNGKPYYVLGEKARPDSTPGTTPGGSSSPKTGDISMTTRWAVLLLATTALTGLTIWDKKRKENPTELP